MQARLTQEAVDEVRLRVLSAVLVSSIKLRNPNPPVQHLRFPRNGVQAYQLRDGNPPSDTDRHPWERGLKLWIDLGYIEPGVVLCVDKAIKAGKRNNAKAAQWAMAPVIHALIERLTARGERMALPKIAKPETETEARVREDLEVAERRQKMLPSIIAASKSIRGYRKIENIKGSVKDDTDAED